MSLTAIGAPLLMTRLFGFFTADTAPVFFPGAPFLAAGVLVVVGALQLARTTRGPVPG